MKNKNQALIAVIAVIGIIAVVAGGTYAYWTWTTNAAQQTTVSFTISDPTQDMYANLTGATATGTALKPAACTAGLKKTITIKYKNNTTQAATVTASLNLTAFTIASATYQPSSANLGNLHWAITTSPSSCSSPVSSGTFASLTFAASSTTPTGLPIVMDADAITFSVPASTSTEQTKTYYLYVWLDSTYTHQNVGSVNSDPMQGLSFTLNWSGTMAQNA